MEKWIALAAGGLTGTFARYFISSFIFKISGPRFPFGTLAVNLSGCFLIGFITALGSEKISLSHDAKLLLITGFCGAYTTFSAFILETDALMKDGGMGLAFLNIMIQVILGFWIFRSGIAAAEWVS